jgi:hypothetical protein
MFATLNCTIIRASESHKAFLTADAILQGWESNYGSIDSMKILYTEQVLDARPNPANKNVYDSLIKFQRIERLEGGKLCHIRHSYSIEANKTSQNFSELSFNGEVTMEYSREEKLGTINRGLLDRNTVNMNHLKEYMLLSPINLEKYRKEYPDGIPEFSLMFRSGISTSKVSIRPNLELVGEEFCHVVEIDDTLKIWVAHGKGMLPLKYEFYKDEGKQISRSMEVEQIGEAETDIGTVWYPIKAHRTSNNSRGMIRFELDVSEFVPNINVDKSAVKFEFPNGTWVVDRIVGLEYTKGTQDINTIPNIHTIEPNETEQDKLKKTPVEQENNVSSEVIIGSEKQNKIENEIPFEPIIDKDKNDKFLGLKNLSFTGVIIFAVFGLLFWYKQRAGT